MKKLVLTIVLWMAFLMSSFAQEAIADSNRTAMNRLREISGELAIAVTANLETLYETTEQLRRDVDDKADLTDFQLLEANFDTLVTFCKWLASQIGVITPIYPYPPYDLDTTQVNTTSIAVIWADSTISPDSFRVDKSLNGSIWTLVEYTTDTTLTISGLTENTAYYIRVYTILNTNTSDVSNVLGVVTDADSPDPPGEEGDHIFVDLNATGLNDGTDWTNAYESFDDISWTNIGLRDGITDTIYVSDGTYQERITIPSGHHNFVIRPAISAGHTGSVIIDGEDIRGGLYMAGAFDSVTVYGLKFQDCTGRTMSCTNGGSSLIRNILFDRDTILNFTSTGIFFEADGGGAEVQSYAMVSNCYLDDKNNITGQSDGIYAQKIKWIRLSGNTIILDNNINISTSTDYHSDNTQAYLVTEVIYDNNYIYYHSDYKGVGTQTLFIGAGLFTGDSDAIHVYYNNVIYRNIPNASDWNLRDKPAVDGIQYCINNTVYSYGKAIGIEVPFYFYNNVVYYKDGGANSLISSVGTNLGRSNNYFYDADGVLGSYSGFTEADPLFTTTTYSTTWDGEIQSGSPLRNDGYNAQSIIEGIDDDCTFWMGTPLEWKDINGDVRDGTPDVGAINYTP